MMKIFSELDEVKLSKIVGGSVIRTDDTGGIIGNVLQVFPAKPGEGGDTAVEIRNINFGLPTVIIVKDVVAMQIEGEPDLGFSGNVTTV